MGSSSWPSRRLPWFKLSLVLMGIVGIVHVTSHALAQTVIQTYSPSDFRGRTMAVFHMTHVVLLAGGYSSGHSPRSLERGGLRPR